MFAVEVQVFMYTGYARFTLCEDIDCLCDPPNCISTDLMTALHPWMSQKS